MSLQVYGCNHIAIEVDDIEKAIAFYKDVFNLEQMSGGEGDAFFKLGEHQCLAVFEVENVQPANMRHFGIMVRDEAQLEEVRKKMIDQLVLKQSTIRPWRLDDADSLARHANNRKVWRALRDVFPHPYTAEDARKFLEATVKIEPITIFCIEVNDAAVGGFGIHLGNDVHRHTAELGYWLGDEFWARGVMTEAVGAFTDFCFDRFSLRRIYAEPFANNT